jgi:two-component system OmpR family response regulator
MGGARILVVEDSDAIRLAVVTALSAQGFQLASVADGSDLEGLLPSFAPDLVILDIMLPGPVDVHISSLRRKLEAGGRTRLVHTVRGRGYLLGTTA